MAVVFAAAIFRTTSYTAAIGFIFIPHNVVPFGALFYLFGYCLRDLGDWIKGRNKPLSMWASLRALFVVLLTLGADSFAQPAQAAMQASAVVICVVDAAQTEDVLFGPGGAAEVMQSASAVMLCPTIGPHDTERLAIRLAQRGLHAIDAPMSGGPARVVSPCPLEHLDQNSALSKMRQAARVRR